MTQNGPKKAKRTWCICATHLHYAPQMTKYLNVSRSDADTHTQTHPHTPMKTDNAPQAVPFGGRKQSLIEDARRERSSSSSGGSPGPSRFGDGFVFEEKADRITLNVLFTLSSEKNAGFFKTGKIFEVRRAFFRLVSETRQTLVMIILVTLSTSITVYQIFLFSVAEYYSMFMLVRRFLFQCGQTSTFTSDRN